MAVDRFCWNAIGPPEWECEAMDSVVCVESIDSRVLGHGHKFVLGHTVRSTPTCRNDLYVIYMMIYCEQ